MEVLKNEIEVVKKPTRYYRQHREVASKRGPRELVGRGAILQKFIVYISLKYKCPGPWGVRSPGLDICLPFAHPLLPHPLPFLDEKPKLTRQSHCHFYCLNAAHIPQVYTTNKFQLNALHILATTEGKDDWILFGSIGSFFLKLFSRWFEPFYGWDVLPKTKGSWTIAPHFFCKPNFLPFQLPINKNNIWWLRKFLDRPVRLFWKVVLF